jgi:hypothetical protein
MKRIFLILFCLTFTATVTWAAKFFNYQPLLDSIQTTVEQAVGAKSSDRLPGGFNRSGFGFPDAIKADVIECPNSISDVKQATDLLQARLSSVFTNRVVSINQKTFKPADDIVLEASLCDASNTNMVMSVTITIFKRSSSHVFLFPVYYGRGGGGVS